MTIAANIQDIFSRMETALERSGRSGQKVQLLPVTKYVESERIREAYDAGLRCFGENRVQEWQQKKDVLPPDIQWHIIGGLQTNKVKYVAGQAALIHSLDRDELAEEIVKQAERRNAVSVDCLVQINSTNEPSKGGLTVDAAAGFLKKWIFHPVLRIRGLMTMGPVDGTEAQIREAFRVTRKLFDHTRLTYPAAAFDILSMGMSGDFEIAIEEGSTLIRVGSLIFGARPAA